MAIIPTVPGTYISERQAGAIPAALARHDACYFLGTSSRSGAPENDPTFVASVADFENVFGDSTESDSWAAVKLFFDQRPGVGVYFMNVAAVGTEPTLTEISGSLGVFAKEDPQGFLLCPEFFANPAYQADHAALAGVLEAHCADPRFYWVALIDASPTTAKAALPGDHVTAAITERNALTSPLGHSWYYSTWVETINVDEVPASAAIAGLAIRRFRIEGYQQPPAGVKYPLYGCKRVMQKLTDAHQTELNPVNVNVIRRLPRHGIVCWGARTASALPAYRYANARVVMNILAGSFRTAYDQLIFTAVDGLGVVFSVLKSTAVALLEPLRLSGALYGASPEDAYRAICDSSNNPGIQLDNGQVNIDIFVRVSPTLEFLGVRLNKVSLATPLDTLLASDDTEALDANISAQA